MEKKADYTELDAEWIQLILQAKNLGIAKEEIRIFLSNQNKEEIKIK